MDSRELPTSTIQPKEAPRIYSTSSISNYDVDEIAILKGKILYKARLMYFETATYQYKYYIILDIYTPEEIDRYSSIYSILYYQAQNKILGMRNQKTNIIKRVKVIIPPPSAPPPPSLYYYTIRHSFFILFRDQYGTFILQISPQDPRILLKLSIFL